MKILFAPDSFKGSLTAIQITDILEKVAKWHFPGVETVAIPVADGGEGTVDALVEGLGGRYVTARVKGPMGTFVTSRYGIMDDETTAIMEMAQAGGIILVDRNDLDPWRANTEGVGEMIRNAIDRGCRNFIIGIGGSATTEGGIGMLSALGYEFYDKKDRLLAPIFENLGNIARISAENVLPELAECHFQIACDVTNPLCGENGAIYVYGPQKGVRLDERVFMDSQMRQYADKTAEAFGVARTGRGNVETAQGPDHYRTSVDKVFTAGDMHRGQSLVVWNIVEGRGCAKEVDEYLMGYTML